MSAPGTIHTTPDCAELQCRYAEMQLNEDHCCPDCGKASLRYTLATPLTDHAAEMLAALQWARTCVPLPSDCHSAIVEAIRKATGIAEQTRLKGETT